MQALLAKRRRNSELINKYLFAISAIFSTVFWYLIGGDKIFWCVIFAAAGLGIDLAKKSELELAAVTRDQRERRIHKAAAFAFMLISILAGLGAALQRSAAVVNQESVVADTTNYDSLIAIQREILDSNLALYQRFGDNYAKEREKVRANMESASTEIARLVALKQEQRQATAGEETNYDMFRLLAKFFHVKSMQNFMVLLLLLATSAVDVAFWLTEPQYWKDEKWENFPTFDFPLAEAPGTRPRVDIGANTLASETIVASRLDAADLIAKEAPPPPAAEATKPPARTAQKAQQESLF